MSCNTPQGANKITWDLPQNFQKWYRLHSIYKLQTQQCLKPEEWCSKMVLKIQFFVTELLNPRQSELKLLECKDNRSTFIFYEGFRFQLHNIRSIVLNISMHNESPSQTSTSSARWDADKSNISNQQLLYIKNFFLKRLTARSDQQLNQARRELDK